MSDNKKKWSVALPVAGTLYKEVEAETEEETIEIALESMYDPASDTFEWEAMRTIVSGNCCHAPTFEASAEELCDG